MFFPITLERWPLYWNRARGGERAGPGLTQDIFFSGCFRSDFSLSSTSILHDSDGTRTYTSSNREQEHRDAASNSQIQEEAEQSGMDNVSQKSHGPSPASQTSLDVLALSEQFRGYFSSCSYEQFFATMIGKGRMAVEGQPAKLMGMSVEQQHACAQQGIWGRSGEEASRTKQGRRGPPLPRQHEPRLTKGAYSFLLTLVLFHISL